MDWIPVGIGAAMVLFFAVSAAVSGVIALKCFCGDMFWNKMVRFAPAFYTCLTAGCMLCAVMMATIVAYDHPEIFG